MELRDALTQISEIRQQMARTQVFRGYRSATALFSAVLAGAAACVQATWVAEPGRNIDRYVMLWGGVALVSILVVGIEMAARYVRTESALLREVTLLAAEQFLPSLVAGALATYVLTHFAPQVTWVLPGLWAILFSLGVFASRRLLPRATLWVAQYYLLAGLLCLTCGGTSALAPWVMGAMFGAGQCLAAGVLYFSLERSHG